MYTQTHMIVINPFVRLYNMCRQARKPVSGLPTRFGSLSENNAVSDDRSQSQPFVLKCHFGMSPVNNADLAVVL